MKEKINFKVAGFKPKGEISIDTDLVEVQDINFTYNVENRETYTEIILAPTWFTEKSLIALANALGDLLQYSKAHQEQVTIRYNLKETLNKVKNSKKKIQGWTYKELMELYNLNTNGSTVLGVTFKKKSAEPHMINSVDKWYTPDGDRINIYYNTTLLDIVELTLEYLIRDRIVVANEKDNQISEDNKKPKAYENALYKVQ